MEFTISNEQKNMLEEVRKFVKLSLNDEDCLDCFSYEQWKKTADFGLFGLIAPEEYGGLGESYLTAALVTEELGYSCKNNGFVFAVNNHIWVGLNLINRFGSKELKDKYIPPMIQGELIGAMAITEADAGSDAHAMTTTYLETEDGYILNGNKMFISNGPIADVFVVFAHKEDGAKNNTTAFVVEKTFEGVTIGKDIEKMGLDACPMSEISFRKCLIPKENLLGKIENANVIMSYALEAERCYEFAPHVGAMQRVMEQCIEYAESRTQFGKRIGEFQAISHKISDMRVNIEFAKLLLYKIAWMKDQGKNTYLESSIFKVFVSEKYIKACEDALQIYGAYGYTVEYGIERELRDAHACSIYSGTNEMQRNTIYSIARFGQ